jgi:ATP-independent RNA helicase DbpA
MNTKESRIDDAVEALGFDSLKKIQEEAIDGFRNHDELMIVAPTGSGKTLAFLLPILEVLENQKVTQALILAPARELALQIEQVFKSMKTDFKINCCYGGHNIQTELQNLSDTPQIIVGTPGRIADHIRRGSIDARNIESLVIDEFDKALELGFEKDMTFIIDELFNVQKRVLVSATESEQLPEFVKMNNPVVQKHIGTKRNEGRLTQYQVRAEDDDKLDILIELILRIGHEPTIIFCNHRDAVERIGELLKKNKIPVGLFHGALKQEHRERELIKLRNESSNILITTDLAARGIDIPSIKNVVHYQLPLKEDAFIHRNGRTARMDASGNSFLMLKSDDVLPEFVDKDCEVFEIKKHPVQDMQRRFVTLFMNLGKKNRINKVDVVGLFYQKGGLQKDELGKIEVLDHCAYIAVAGKQVGPLIRNLKNEKIKKKSFILEVSR